jgi:hypothetical protein
MGLFRPFNATRRVAGLNELGPVERSIGYLQGGYYTGTLPAYLNSGNPAGTTTPPPGVSEGSENAWSAVQAFNCITQVGRLIYDSGYYRRYYAGITGNFAGYFSINNTYDYQKFSYFTTTAASSFSISQANNSSAVDLNAYTQAWIFRSSSSESTGSSINDYVKINLANDTPSDQGNLGSGPLGTSRQALNNQYAAFLYGGSSIYSLNYSSQSVTSQGSFFRMEQISCGMSVTDDYGYVVGYSNIKANLSGASMTSYSVANSYVYNFGESHSLTNSVFGFMMGGYPDTTGRYSNGQHGLVNRLTLAGEAVTVMNDLVIPQSSGQMMAGF